MALDLLDFLKPAFQGKLISVYPHDDDAALYLFYRIICSTGSCRNTAGTGWTATWPASRTSSRATSRWRARLPTARWPPRSNATITTAGGLKRQGAPIEIAFPAEDEVPVFTVTGGIFKDAPHPNAAKLFLTWYLGKEQQARLGTFSPRLDVPPPSGFKPLTSYKIANAFREFITDDKLIADLRKRFEAYTGPAVNKGGVR